MQRSAVSGATIGRHALINVVGLLGLHRIVGIGDLTSRTRRLWRAVRQLLIALPSLFLQVAIREKPIPPASSHWRFRWYPRRESLPAG